MKTKKLTEKEKKRLKKIIAREFIYTLIYFILFIILGVFCGLIYNCNNDTPLIIFYGMGFLLFPFRYIIYATKWSLKQLKEDL